LPRGKATIISTVDSDAGIGYPLPDMLDRQLVADSGRQTLHGVTQESVDRMANVLSESI
jgi:hypothetical protein